MKKKKQTRKIKQWLAAALGLTLLGTGLWVGMNEEKLQAKDLVTVPTLLKNDENRISQREGETWLPITSFDKWQSAETNFVPREAPFIMMEMENTEVVRYSKNFSPTKSGEGANRWGYTLQQGPLEIVFKNVGYYNGHFVGTRVTLTPKLDASKPKPTDEWGDNYFYTAGSQIFTWGNTPSTTTNIEYVDVKMEFLEDNDETKPMELPAYLTYTNIPGPANYSVSFPLDKLLTVLSQGMSTDNLQYQINDNEFIFNNNGHSSGNSSMMEFVFIPSYSLDYRSYRKSENSFGFHYYTKPDAMVQFPEPQGSNQAFEITEKNVDNLYSQFVQFIPYEEPKYRTQTATWITDYGMGISNTANNVAVGEWKVQNELGQNSIGLYTISNVADQNLTSKLVGLKSIEDVNLYNHYYTFRRPILINYGQSIEEEYLTDSINTGNYQRYYVETGRVQIDSKNLTPPPNTNYVATTPLYQTKVNFGAEIDYKFVDSAGAPISAGLVEENYREYATGTKKGEGLVTWLAPLPGKDPVAINPTDSPYTAANAPKVTGYRFKSAKLNGQLGDMQVKYSKLLRDQEEGEAKPVDPDDENNYTKNNEVTLEYESLAYDVEIQVNKPDGTSLQSSANSLFEISKDNGAAWDTASNYPFVAGETYEIRQSGVVSTEGYMKAAGTAKFTVSMAADRTITVTNLTNPTNEAYDFDVENNKLKITVKNDPGSLVSITAPELNYGTDNQLPSANMILQRKGDPWQIKFEDNRPESARKAPYLYVTLTKEFTEDTTNDVLPNILFFTSTAVTKPEEVKDDSYLTLNALTPIDIQEVSPDTWAYGENTLKPWDANKGFLLNMKEAYESGKINIGTSNYTADLTFTLAEDPINPNP